MARTLLDAVNLLLSRVREVDSRGALTTLTDSARQPKIDLAVRCWNDVTGLLYELTGVPMPTGVAQEATITLQTDVRIYALASELVHLYWPLRIQGTQGHRIWQYAPDEPDGGYMRLLEEDLNPTQRRGRPQRAAFTPTRRELYLDCYPTETENGDIYDYIYSRRINLGGADDTFPFGDATVDALIPAAAELWRGDYQAARDSATFRTFMGQAARTLRPDPPRRHW